MTYLIVFSSQVFISIKGVYYQAEIFGQEVTWVVPHKLGYEVSIQSNLYKSATFGSGLNWLFTQVAVL